jgi:hypothetical protein
MPHLFDCVFHHISHNLYAVLLPKSSTTTNRLAFDSGIPLWLNNVNSACGCDIQSKNRKKKVLVGGKRMQETLANTLQLPYQKHQ